MKTAPLVLILFLARTPLFGADTLIDAVHRRDAARVRSALAEGRDLKAADEDGNTALHWAARNGDARLVQELIDRGAPVNAANHVGATALLYAVGTVDSVKILLDRGAQVNRASKFGTTPLIAAARYPRSSAVVRLLLERRADPHANKESGFDALRAAGEAGDSETYKMLLAAGVKPANVIAPAMMGHRAILEMALNAGANIDFDGGHAGHALNFALYGHQPEIAKLLIERGADLNFRSPGENIRRRRFFGPHTMKVEMPPWRAR